MIGTEPTNTQVHANGGAGMLNIPVIGMLCAGGFIFVLSAIVLTSLGVEQVTAGSLGITACVALIGVLVKWRAQKKRKALFFLESARAEAERTGEFERRFKQAKRNGDFDMFEGSK